MRLRSRRRGFEPARSGPRALPTANQGAVPPVDGIGGGERDVGHALDHRRVRRVLDGYPSVGRTESCVDSRNASGCIGVCVFWPNAAAPTNGLRTLLRALAAMALLTVRRSMFPMAYASARSLTSTVSRRAALGKRGLFMPFSMNWLTRPRLAPHRFRQPEERSARARVRGERRVRPRCREGSETRHSSLVRR